MAKKGLKEIFEQIASGDTQSALEVKLNSFPAAAISRRALLVLKIEIN